MAGRSCWSQTDDIAQGAGPAAAFYQRQVEGLLTVPSSNVLLRLVGFMVPCVLLLSGVQPLVGAAAGGVETGWAMVLAGPAVLAALLLFFGGRLLDRGNSVQPPWYTAWVLLPGAFVLAGAAAMCILGSLVEFSRIAAAMWLLLGVGVVLWSGALLVVRHESR